MLSLTDGRAALTTDSYVVRSLFFPGGDIGRHGIVVLAQRKGLAFATVIESDGAPLHGTVAAVLAAGVDPLQVACEGRFVAYVPAAQADAALAILRQQPGGEAAARIGTVARTGDAVTLRSLFGIDRPLDLPADELLPRICRTLPTGATDGRHPETRRNAVNTA